MYLCTSFLKSSNQTKEIYIEGGTKCYSIKLQLGCKAQKHIWYGHDLLQNMIHDKNSRGCYFYLLTCCVSIYPINISVCSYQTRSYREYLDRDVAVRVGLRQ